MLLKIATVRTPSLEILTKGKLKESKMEYEGFSQ